MLVLFPPCAIPMKAEMHVNTEGIGDCLKRSDLKLNTAEIQSRDCRMISFDIFSFVEHVTDNTIVYCYLWLLFLTKKSLPVKAAMQHSPQMARVTCCVASQAL